MLRRAVLLAAGLAVSCAQGAAGCSQQIGVLQCKSLRAELRC